MTPSCCGAKDPVTPAEIPRRVIVIDDEPLVRWSFTTGLRAAGFEAVAVVDGNEARALARQLPRPDVVLLDANFWEANPWRLLDDLREAAPRCRFLILLVAGQEVALPPVGPRGCHSQTIRSASGRAPRGGGELPVAVLQRSPSSQEKSA